MHTTRSPSPAEWGATLLRVSLGIMFLAHSVVLKLLTYSLPGTARFFEGVGLPGWLAYLTFACVAQGLLGDGALALSPSRPLKALPRRPALPAAH